MSTHQCRDHCLSSSTNLSHVRLCHLRTCTSKVGLHVFTEPQFGLSVHLLRARKTAPRRANHGMRVEKFTAIINLIITWVPKGHMVHACGHVAHETSQVLSHPRSQIFTETDCEDEVSLEHTCNCYSSKFFLLSGPSWYFAPRCVPEQFWLTQLRDIGYS